MVIRVSGHAGAGKTTLCKRLAAALGCDYHYAGGIFRAMAAERGQSIEEFYAALSRDPAAEADVDQRQIEIMAAKDSLVMEGRIAPFLPCPFPAVNVLLTVDPLVGARRCLERPENAGRTVEEMARKTAARVADERAHYYALHGIEDHFDPAHFDIAVDTTSLSPDEVYERVYSAVTA